MRWQERSIEKDATTMYNCRYLGALRKTRRNPLKYHIVHSFKEEVYRKDTAAGLNAPKTNVQERYRYRSHLGLLIPTYVAKYVAT